MVRATVESAVRRLPGSVAWNIASAVTLLNVVIASGFSIAALVQVGAATRALASYAAARTLSLAAFVLASVIRRSKASLMVLGGLAGLIRAIGGCVGLLQRDAGKTIGPIVIAIAQFLALFALRGSLRDA